MNRHSTDREIALMVLMAYLSYLLAEVGDGMNKEWGDVQGMYTMI